MPSFRLPMLLLPLLLTAAHPAKDDPATALLECRLAPADAEATRAGLRELNKQGDPGEYETIYDVANARPFGTRQPLLTVTDYENAYGSLSEYRTLLTGKYESVKKALLKAHDRAECDKTSAQLCSFETPDRAVELSLNAKGQLALVCSYEG
jgi:hypothetical protein